MNMHEEFNKSKTLEPLSFEEKDVAPEKLLEYAETFEERVDNEFRRKYAEGMENIWPTSFVTQIELVSGWLSMASIYGKIDEDKARSLREEYLVPLNNELVAMREEYVKEIQKGGVSPQSQEPDSEKKGILFSKLKQAVEEITKAVRESSDSELVAA